VTALLDIRALSVRFPTAQGELSALDSVALELQPGATLGLVGESGSGKSLLCRAILGLLPRAAFVAPEARIRFGGEDLLRLDSAAMRAIRGRRIAMVFQDPMTSLNPVRTIAAQLIEGMRVHLGLASADARQRALELLDQVGITAPEQRLGQYPHELSGGMRQRVAIAMAIACRPELLIADEPTTALDVTVQAEVLQLLRRLQSQHRMAMILVTHDLGLAAGYTDEIAVMYAGQIVERAATRVLFKTPRMPYTRALIASVPRLDGEPQRRLVAIPGRAATFYGDPPQCRFAPRCERREARCLQEKPALVPAGSDRHLYRCWNPEAA